MKLMTISAVLAVVALAGCGTASQFNGYVKASPAQVQSAMQGNMVEPVFAQIAIVQNPDFNGGKISPKAMAKIGQYSGSCQQQVHAQLAGPLQSGLNGGVSYGLAGAVGTAGGAKAAFGSAVSAADYAAYGGIASMTGGAVNGLVTGSYAMASAVGTCTRDFWEDVVRTDSDFKGTHIVVAYAGKRRGGSTPPAYTPPQR